LTVSEDPFSLQLPYSNRQKIVIVPDEIANAERKARAEAPDAQSVEELAKVVLAGLPMGIGLRWEIPAIRQFLSCTTRLPTFTAESSSTSSAKRRSC
jgi:hypothetical protein